MLDGPLAQLAGIDARLSYIVCCWAVLSPVARYRMAQEKKIQRFLDAHRAFFGDEAAMADTRRLARVVELTCERDAKLVLAGDSAQLSPIGAGGLFGEITERAPTARLTEVYRANHDWEREAWGRLRRGEAESALAAYQHAVDDKYRFFSYGDCMFIG